MTRAEAKRDWRRRERERSAGRPAWNHGPKRERAERKVVPIGTPKIIMSKPTKRDTRRKPIEGDRLVTTTTGKGLWKRPVTFLRQDGKPWQTAGRHQS